MDFQTFFVLLSILSLLDAYTTYQGIKKSQAKEANPIVRAFIKQFGLKDGLLIAKIAYLAYAWFHPITNPNDQWLVLGALAAASVWNYYISNKKT